MSRDLRLLAGAVLLSAAGDLLALIVLALQVHALTGSGPAVSALIATTLVPWWCSRRWPGSSPTASRASACWWPRRRRRPRRPPR